MAFVHAVLDGAMPGAVFVDDAAAPRAAVVANDCDFWFALGAPDAAFLAAVIPVLVEERTRYAPRPWLWATTAAIADVLAPMFAESERRKEFHWQPEAAAPAAGLPPGITLAPLDAALAGRIAGHMDPWIANIFGGPEALTARSFGWFAVDGGEPVAMCIACAIGGPDGAIEAEIEVGTDPAYQQRGLATAVVSAFIATCRERGALPAWTCAADNEPSWRLAQRCGFVEFREVTGHTIRAGMTFEGGRWRLPGSRD